MYKNIAINIKIIIFAFNFLIGFDCFGQIQKIAYVDTDYIMENIPEYQEAKSQLEKFILEWQSKIEQRKVEIKKLKNKLDIDRVFLTKEFIGEREIEIKELQKSLNEFQRDIFGENGKLVSKRQSLVKPIQDQLWNIVNEIAIKRKYSFVFDKADILMIYSDKKYDISDRVLEKMNVKLKSDK